MMERTINYILESLSDEEWTRIKMKIEAKKAHDSARVIRIKNDSEIKFANWILENNVCTCVDSNNSPHWYRKFDDEIEYYSTSELHSIYLRCEWDEILE